MKKGIYIFGAGGFAREVFYLVQEIEDYHFHAFVEKENSTDKILINDKEYPIISEDSFHHICKEEKNLIYAAIALADVKTVKIIINKFANNCIFPNLIHPSVKIFGTLKIGNGNIIAYNCVISDNVKLGSFNRINIGTIIGHDVQIGDNNHINPTCNISGNVLLGNNNFLGVNCVVLQNLSITNDVVIGASSLVLRKIDESGTYIGVPAKKIIF